MSTAVRGRWLAIWSLVVAACTHFACAGQNVTALPPDDLAALERAVGAEMKAANDGDSASWASLYTDDAIVLRPNETAIQGRQAIQQWLATLPRITNANGEGVEIAG